MDDKKIQARNKFVGKINGKIEKLTEDIRLLIEVDQALNVQTGGGLIQDAINASKAKAVVVTTEGTIPSPNTTALTSAAETLTRELAEKVRTLESTLGILLTHILSNNAQAKFNLGSLTPQVVNADALNDLTRELSGLDSKLDLPLLKSYGELFDKYKNKSVRFDRANFTREANGKGITDQAVIDLLLKSIDSARA